MNIKDMLLYSTFSHIKGISENKERHYWNNGVENLDDLNYLINGQLSFFNETSFIEKSMDSLNNGDIDIFRDNLKRSEYYRIAYSFPDDVMFLDIETTGLSKVYSYITMIGWMKSGIYKYTMIGNDINEFIDDLNNSKILVTFNGSIFDLPFIKYKYSKYEFNFSEKAHIDLRFLAKSYGYSGGQKEIEKQLSFKRPKYLSETNGKEATVLWYKFLYGDNSKLSLLLKYNCYDILGMVYILNYLFFNNIYGKKIPSFGNPKYFSRKFKKSNIVINQNWNTKTKQFISSTITYFKHCNLKESYDMKIIGIDLTGSEKRATGCAKIIDDETFTCLINKDDDIIQYILDNKADLVSIDSPLSLPIGRNTAFDDDPTRAEFGIMRICERVLKKRGVNVYPALIPSMQRLTTRGIKLAKQIRSLGIPVIESFPGAAQDVLQIPRKRTDLGLLKKGLIEFGIKGEFEYNYISHDELDAITSALVGQFFISGYYEPLGCEEENYLIIPSVKNKRLVNNKVIGICGPISTGKTLAAKYIKKKGYHYNRYSKIISSS